MSRALGNILCLVAATAVILFAAPAANANHAWNGYHWSRPANPFTVTLADNLTSNWTSYLAQAASDWSLTAGACNNPQNPIRCSIVSGGGSAKACKPPTGQVKVCNAAYGNTGWLGL